MNTLRTLMFVLFFLTFGSSFASAKVTPNGYRSEFLLGGETLSDVALVNFHNAAETAKLLDPKTGKAFTHDRDLPVAQEVWVPIAETKAKPANVASFCSGPLITKSARCQLAFSTILAPEPVIQKKIPLPPPQQPPPARTDTKVGQTEPTGKEKEISPYEAPMETANGTDWIDFGMWCALALFILAAFVLIGAHYSHKLCYYLDLHKKWNKRNHKIYTMLYACWEITQFDLFGFTLKLYYDTKDFLTTVRKPKIKAVLDTRPEHIKLAEQLETIFQATVNFHAEPGTFGYFSHGISKQESGTELVDIICSVPANRRNNLEAFEAACSVLLSGSGLQYGKKPIRLIQSSGQVSFSVTISSLKWPKMEAPPKTA